MGGLRKAYQNYLIPTQDEPGGSGRGPVPGPAGGTAAAVSLLRSPTIAAKRSAYNRTVKVEGAERHELQRSGSMFGFTF
jgi:hypothetical protein